MDRLVRRRQREARRGRQGAAVTTLASLPAEVLGSIIERACASDYRRVASLRELTKFGCVSKSFLESLKYVSTLEIDVLKNVHSSPEFVSTDAGLEAPATYDSAVQVWCDIARRRLQHVRRIDEKQTDIFFSPRQTQMLIDCVASFPSLEGLRSYDGDPVTVCVSMAAKVRTGGFRNLRHLVLHSSMYHPETPARAHFRQRIKLCYRDLISQLPPALGMDLMTSGADVSLHLYPSLLIDDGEWDVWASVLSDLLSRGVSDLHSRRILCELLDWQDFAYEGSPSKLEAFSNVFETLLVEHGVDADCLVEKRKFLYPEMRFPRRALEQMLEELSKCISVYDGDSDDDDDYIDSQREAIEPTIRFVMRTIDLFVRHGGTSTRDHFPEDEEDEIEENTDVRDFILERTDCTPRVREAINRGELYYWQHVSSM